MNGIVLYDGECSFCAAQVRFITGRDTENHFHLVPLQSEEGRSVLLSAGMGEISPDTVVYMTHGKYLQRSAAVLTILRDLGGRWKILYGLIIIPPFIRDFFYNLIARNRHRLFTVKNRQNNCHNPA